MIKVIRTGKYRLVETKHQVKILYLDNRTLVWLHVPGIGHMLEISDKPHTPEHALSCGNYRIYDVKEEPGFADLKHLELFVGGGRWQGYLLLTGLPTASRKRTKIIPIKEIISLRRALPAY